MLNNNKQLPRPTLWVQIFYAVCAYDASPLASAPHKTKSGSYMKCSSAALSLKIGCRAPPALAARQSSPLHNHFSLRSSFIF
ncbi:hypothetical protein EVAR_93894_1 [Eumeta japonica]|uniref:Uncharacterized protein n=1 Tax=Eumeta variegata TaxID=151549 RepID=A0A4C1TWT4_EUMVA|nr:hypothetical protein EVAR_93894_1 [Eumeta japonica]